MIQQKRRVGAFFLSFIVYLLMMSWTIAPGLLEVQPLKKVENPIRVRQIASFEPFSFDERLSPKVNFWVQIYSRYFNHQGVIHDAKYIDHIYEEIDLNSYIGDTSDDLKAVKEKWKSVLISVHTKQNAPETMTAEEKKVFDLFSDVHEPDKFLNAASGKRVRFQQGQKDFFMAGYRQSGLYLPLMEEIFRNAGLPVELTRLPFVESSFNLRARSKVGASGIWQFMRSTGRLYLTINDALDERNDPIRATEAASQLLKGNFEALGKWPLAITAYNHGRMGMVRAVQEVGSQSLEDLIDSYQGVTFGFASRNFYSEFLAAVEVERNAEQYFGKIERFKPLDFYEVKVPDFIDIYELTRFLNLDIVTIRLLNPGLTEAVYSGKLYVPANYALRLPRDQKVTPEVARQVFLMGYEQIPPNLKLQAQPSRKYVKRESN